MSKALRKYLNNIKNKDIEYVNETNSNDKNSISIIKILSKVNKVEKQVLTTLKLDNNAQYKVVVRLYMTKPDSLNFTFHKTWNNSKEMPFRIMYGKVLEETKTMVKMHLRAKITQTDYCIKCGRLLTNDISKLYGLGPECGQHYYINPLSLEEFEKYKQSIQQKLEEIEWEGWIPKVAIISMEVCNEHN